MTSEEAKALLTTLLKAAPEPMANDSARADGGYWRGVVVGLLLRTVPEMQSALAAFPKTPTDDPMGFLAFGCEICGDKHCPHHADKSATCKHFAQEHEANSPDKAVRDE